MPVSKNIQTLPYLIARFSSQLTCFNQRFHLRGEGTSSRGWCSIQTLSSWTSRQVFIIMIIVCHNDTCHNDTCPPQCPGCYKITTIFSHAHTVVVCSGCSSVLCQPTGGRTKLSEGEYKGQLSDIIVLIPSRMCLPEKKLIYICSDFDNVF